MRENHLWNRAKNAPIQVGAAIAGDFDIGFDDRIPEETRQALLRFICWVEEHFSLPVTLWVDFKYNHYLLDKNKQRVPYKFYWVDFENYPVFLKEEDIPVIELAARTEHTSAEQLLSNFASAITHYFAWLNNAYLKGFIPDEADVESILCRYFKN